MDIIHTRVAMQRKCPKFNVMNYLRGQGCVSYKLHRAFR